MNNRIRAGKKGRAGSTIEQISQEGFIGKEKHEQKVKKRVIGWRKTRAYTNRRRGERASEGGGGFHQPRSPDAARFQGKNKKLNR